MPDAPAPSARPAPRRSAAGATPATTPARKQRATAPAPEAGTPSTRRIEARVYDAILRALLGGALRPGTPLRERQLAGTFQATRGVVRKVLARLGAEGKLELRPQRGAFVPQPDREDVRHVYELRQVLECGMVALLAERGVPAGTLAALDQVLAAERRAQREARRDDAVRLAGDLHRLLAASFGNPELAAALDALIARTQLFVALFESAQAASCAVDEHAAIARALRRRDAAAAVRAMHDHLGEVQRRVLSRMPRPDPPDVAAILRASMEPPP